MERILFIGIGGFIGAVTRFLISTLVGNWLGQTFPWGTLLINFSGSLLLGVFIASTGSRIDPRLRLFVATGFFGAYTTFSTFANESVAMIQAGDWLGGLGNIMVTNLVCILGAAIGVAIGNQL
jgi:CrcB protein